MRVQQINSITDIAASEWNQLAGTSYPFLRHEFLAALEQSGSVSPKTGWRPQHLLLYEDQELIAACPLYIKIHSRGEFVFDQQWAMAYRHHGLDYYPKLLTAVPFTPCIGQRILIKDPVDSHKVLTTLIMHIQQLSLDQEYSSWHCLFTTPQQNQALHKQGLLLRNGVQFQWFNQQYRDFQDYCSHFTARKRKTIVRERRLVVEQGIEFEHLSGTAIQEQHWQIFYKFYQSTYAKHGMDGYLNLAFFRQIAATLPEHLLLIVASKQRTPVGAALCFVDDQTLYGRYWGCDAEYPFLHFETCYYQGLDYCLTHGLQRFDSGAQGEHKIARGFQPITTYSAHWLQDQRFAVAVQRFLTEEQQAVEAYREDCVTLLPFKTSG